MAEDEYEPEDVFDPASVAQAAQERLTEQGFKAETAAQQLRSRREAYIRVFTNGSPSAGDVKIVLDDLKRFCRFDSTPFDPDPRIHALLTGRFEVYKRINDHVKLTSDELLELYTRKPEQYNV